MPRGLQSTRCLPGQIRPRTGPGVRQELTEPTVGRIHQCWLHHVGQEVTSDLLLIYRQLPPPLAPSSPIAAHRPVNGCASDPRQSEHTVLPGFALDPRQSEDAVAETVRRQHSMAKTAQRMSPLPCHPAHRQQ